MGPQKHLLLFLLVVVLAPAAFLSSVACARPGAHTRSPASQQQHGGRLAWPLRRQLKATEASSLLIPSAAATAPGRDSSTTPAAAPPARKRSRKRSKGIASPSSTSSSIKRRRGSVKTGPAALPDHDWIAGLTAPTASISSPLAGDVFSAATASSSSTSLVATVVFDGSKSQAEAGSSISSHHWRVTGPEGHVWASTGPTASLQLPPGAYTARLAVTSVTGDISSDTVAFRVAPPAQDATASAAVPVALPLVQQPPAPPAAAVVDAATAFNASQQVPEQPAVVLPVSLPAVAPVTPLVPTPDTAAATLPPPAAAVLPPPAVLPPAAAPVVPPVVVPPPAVVVPEVPPPPPAQPLLPSSVAALPPAVAPTPPVATVTPSLPPPSPAAAPLVPPALSPPTVVPPLAAVPPAAAPPAAASPPPPAAASPPPPPPVATPAPPPPPPPPAQAAPVPPPAPTAAPGGGMKVDERFCNVEGDYDLISTTQDWDDMQACCKQAIDLKVVVTACSNMPARPASPTKPAPPVPAEPPTPAGPMEDLCVPSDYNFGKQEDRRLWELCCKDARELGSDADCASAQWS